MAGEGEEVGADVGEVFGEGGDVDVLALDAQPEAALWEVEGDAEAENEDNGGRPDEGGAAVFGDKKDGGFCGVVDGDGPLVIEAVACLTYL